MDGRRLGTMSLLPALLICMFFLLYTVFIQGMEGREGREGAARRLEEVSCAERVSGTVLLVLPPGDFSDREYQRTRLELETAGLEVEVASTLPGTVRGPEGIEVLPDKLIDEIKVEDYVALVFIGGGGAGRLCDDEAVLDLAREADREGKVIGAICLAPVILAEAGVLNGRNATAIPSVEDDLDAGGANYVYRDVVADGNIVTGCAPHASQAFGEKLVDNLAP